ncbi:hypothetical protein [Nocardia sp. bgisy134]|uniref:hypothetical protein n=1 Tax=unclassified Nocardia TaxID=2637762 RepID=UPI003D739C56
MGQIARVALTHEHDLFAGLTDDEYEQLANLLDKLVETRELTPGVHPGYRTLGS